MRDTRPDYPPEFDEATPEEALESAVAAYVELVDDARRVREPLFRSRSRDKLEAARLLGRAIAALELVAEAWPPIALELEQAAEAVEEAGRHRRQLIRQLSSVYSLLRRGVVH